MKRAVLVSLGVVLLVLGLISLQFLGAPPPTTAQGESNRSADALRASVPVDSEADSIETTDREELDSPVERPAIPGGLTVELAFEGTEIGVRGIGVTVIPRNGRSRLLNLRQQVTDESGLAVFDALAPGLVDITVSTIASTRGAIEPSGQAHVRLEVPRGIRVEGLVIGPGGDPVANAQVLYWDRIPGTFTELPVPVVVTDGLGRFTIDPFLRTGLLSATAQGYLPSPRYSLRRAEGERIERFSGTPSATPPQEETEVTISLHIELGSTPELVTGIVVNEDGAPVNHARVTMTPPPSNFFRDEAGNHVENDQPAVRVTGDDGRFSLQVPQGSGLVVRAAGYAPHRQALDVSKGERLDLEIVLTVSPGIWGRVRSTTGRPIAGATVGHSSDQLGLTVTAKTARDGTYHLDAVLVGSPLRVYATDPDHLIQRATLRVEPEGGTEWNPELEPLARLRGRVVDEVGRPLTGWSLEISPPTSPMRSPYVPVRTETAEDGGFDVGVLRDKPYVPELREPGQWIQVDLTHLGELYGDQPELLIVVDSSKRATSTVRGVLRDGMGRPVDGVSLQLYDGPRTARLDVQTDGSGQFEIGPIVPRHYRLQASGSLRNLPRMDLIEFNLGPGQDLDLGDLTIASQGTLAYSIRGADGEPISPNPSAFLHSDSSTEETFLDFDAQGDGRVNVPAGDYIFQVIALRHAGISRRITVATGQEVTVSLRLFAGDYVRLNPVLPDTAELPDGEHVEARALHPNGDWSSYLDVVAANGNLYRDVDYSAGNLRPMTLSSVLAPGTYTLELTSDSGKVFTGRFAVLEGRNPDETITVHCLAK